jgi:hypothetical protein
MGILYVGGSYGPGALDLDLHDFQAQGGQNVAIGRIAGGRNRDAVANVEQCQEGQIERGG